MGFSAAQYLGPPLTIDFIQELYKLCYMNKKEKSFLFRVLRLEKKKVKEEEEEEKRKRK